MLIWPEASSAQKSIAAVSADGGAVCVLILHLNSSCNRLIAASRPLRAPLLRSSSLDTFLQRLYASAHPQLLTPLTVDMLEYLERTNANLARCPYAVVQRLAIGLKVHLLNHRLIRIELKRQILSNRLLVGMSAPLYRAVA
jgi:hypothetical protein